MTVISMIIRAILIANSIVTLVMFYNIAKYGEWTYIETNRIILDVEITFLIVVILLGLYLFCRELWEEGIK